VSAIGKDVGGPTLVMHDGEGPWLDWVDRPDPEHNPAGHPCVRIRVSPEDQGRWFTVRTPEDRIALARFILAGPTEEAS
jgi:hypothetical protein